MASASADVQVKGLPADLAAAKKKTHPSLVEEGEVAEDSGPKSQNSVEEETANSKDVVMSGYDQAWVAEHTGVTAPSDEDRTADAPPLPEEAPPLPAEALPATAEVDDGWAPVWEETSQAFYFYNRFTGATQWHNPRVPEAPLPPGVAPIVDTQPAPPTGRPEGGYNPAIHGDYDPEAWYAQPQEPEQPPLPTTGGPVVEYAATGAFNRFTGRWQAADLTPENFNDANKSKRQMNAFFDVDAAANSHDGRSLKEERSGKKLSKQELKEFKEKRKAKKEEKRRAWLRD